MALAVLGLVSACGTTVDGAEEALLAQGTAMSDDGMTIGTTRAGGGGAPATTGTTATGGSTGDTSTPDTTAGGGSATGDADSGTTEAPVTSEPPPTEGAPTGSVGPGVTDDTVKIGMVYDRSAGALNAAWGFSGAGQIDQKLAQELLVDHINDNGGVAGRQVEIVWYVGDQLSGKTYEQVGQEACATWTQDNQVFAAVTWTFMDSLNACLTEAGVVQVGGSLGMAYDETFNRFPYLVALSDPSVNSVAQVAVDSLAARGFYDEARPAALAAPMKIGLVAYDSPAFKSGAATLERALAAHGLELSEEVFIRRGETPEEIGAEANAVRAAALRFKEQGITHVQFLMTNNGLGQFTFWQNADSLQYQPRYGLTSLDAAQALIPTFESANPGGPGRQFQMAVGVGWVPLKDVPRQDYSGEAESAALRQCKAITEPASNGGFDDAARNKEIIAAELCDNVTYFQAAVNSAGPTPNADSWLRGVASVADLGSAFSFVLRTERQHDGIGAVRDFAFHDDCGCFHYAAPPRGI